MNPWLWLRRLQSSRTHRVTTITRTVTREPGARPEQEVVREEETVEPPGPGTTVAAHVSIAVISVAAITASAFLLGWLIRRWSH